MKNKIAGFILLSLMLISGAVVAASKSQVASPAKFDYKVPVGWVVSPFSDNTILAVLKEQDQGKAFSPTMVLTLITERPQMPADKTELKSVVDQLEKNVSHVPNTSDFKMEKSAIEDRRGLPAFYYLSSHTALKATDNYNRRQSSFNYIFQEKDSYLALTLVCAKNDFKKYESVARRFADSIIKK